MLISENGKTFYGCNSADDIKNGLLEIPLGVVEIVDNACHDRKDIYNVNFPVGLKKIGSNSFINNINMKTPKFPWSLENIDNAAFSGNIGFTGSLDFRDTKMSVGGISSNAFYGTNIDTVLMDNFINIENNPFDNCNKLNKVVIAGKSYNYKFVKPFILNTDEVENHSFLIENTRKKMGVNIHQGLLWGNDFVNIMLDKVSVFVAEKEIGNEVVTGIGGSSYQALVSLRENIERRNIALMMGQKNNSR